jgi:hypothetical protein
MTTWGHLGKMRDAVNISIVTVIFLISPCRSLDAFGKQELLKDPGADLRFANIRSSLTFCLVVGWLGKWNQRVPQECGQNMRSYKALYFLIH